MAPITLFSIRKDPGALVRQLRTWGLAVALDGSDEDWRNAKVGVDSDSAPASLGLTFRYDPAYCSEPQWSQQLRGMQGFFQSFPDTPRSAEVIAFIGTLRCAYATIWEPEMLDEGERDDRISLVCALARKLDCVLFSPSVLRDCQGLPLLSADGEYRPEAMLPPYPMQG